MSITTRMSLPAMLGYWIGYNRAMRKARMDAAREYRSQHQPHMVAAYVRMARERNRFVVDDLKRLHQVSP